MSSAGMSGMENTANRSKVIMVIMSTCTRTLISVIPKASLKNSL